MEPLDVSFFCKTKPQAIDFANRIASVMHELYSTSFNLDKTLMKSLGMQKKDKLLSLMRERGVVIDSRQSLKAFFEEIQSTVSKLSLLTLTVAFDPDETTLSSLSQWFLLNIKKQVLFEIVVKEELIGGALISYNGKFLDCSLKERFGSIVTDVLYPKEQPTPPKHQSVEHMHLGR
jgi:F0F1-type ATP synthase delta subunit